MPLPQFTTVPDKTLGDVFTEAMWDTYIRDNLNTLGNQPKALIYSNTDQAIANSSLVDKTLDLTLFDTDAMKSGNGLLINTAGYYLIGGTIMWQASGGGDRWLSVQVNNKWAAISRITPAPGTVQTHQHISTVRYIPAGMLVKLTIYQGSGGSLLALAAVNYNTPDDSSAPNLYAVRLG